MEKLIIIKYGELTTKKDNINFFIKTLKKNIETALSEEDITIEYDKARMFIYSKNIDEVLIKLKNVFGIHSLIIGYKLESREFNNVADNVLELINNYSFKTFKVVTKRSDKNYPLKSMDFSKDLGAFLLNAKENIKVDINKPDITINIEIRVKNIYVYFESVVGLEGYPVGVAGKGLLMLSGGIDSPVSGYLAMKRGVKIECIYFESPPHTSAEAKNKVISLVRKLSMFQGEIKLYIINFTKIQETIYKNIPHEYLVTIMRRFMYRISELVAVNNNCKVIINGESIGQVASQTLTSMQVINKVVSIPVIRPVACFDKNEIISLARKINTYEISILPYEDCCTLFVPEHPVINPKVSLALEYENLIPVKELIYEAYKNKKVIHIGKRADNDLL